MIDVVRDIILAAAGISVLLVLNRASSRQRPVPRGVWPFVLAGFSLLLMGRVLEMFDATALSMPAVTKVVLQEVLGFCGGFITLSIGLIRWLPHVTGAPKRPATAVPPESIQKALVIPDGHASHEMLISVLKSSLSGVLVTKAVRDDTEEIVDFEVVLMNEAAQQILGRSSSNLVGRRILKEFQCIQRENLLGHMVSVIETGLPFRDERQFNHDRNGRWYQYVAVKLGDGLAVTFGDVSDRKRAEDQLRHAAHHDTLTSLPNRALFTERLEQAINRAKRFPDYKFAVLFLDFDRFKYVNDTLGHDAGDQLLLGISTRLRENLRGFDMPSRASGDHLPARLGGDEFVILLDAIQGVQDAVAVAERLQVALSAPHNLDGHDVVSTASIGVVTSEIGYDSADAMIRDADTAMYQAKTTGKARHVVFDERMHEKVVNRSNLEQELRHAVAEDAFQLHFEPIVNLESGGIRGFEALVRWPHATRGTLPPSEFMETAEEIGLAMPIGHWTVRAACLQLKQWRQAFSDHESLFVSVHLFPQQLQHPDLVPFLRSVLDETDLPADALRLEVTETMVMSDPGATPSILDELDQLGIQLVLDDFGTGHSSLSCLHRFPLDVLKIDRELVGSVRNRRDYGAIVNALVELGHNLDIEVMAEGVSDADQLVLLQALNCDDAQGSIFGEPVSAEDAETLLGRDAPFANRAAAA